MTVTRRAVGVRRDAHSYLCALGSDLIVAAESACRGIDFIDNVNYP